MVDKKILTRIYTMLSDMEQWEQQEVLKEIESKWYDQMILKNAKNSDYRKYADRRRNNESGREFSSEQVHELVQKEDTYQRILRLSQIISGAGQVEKQRIAMAVVFLAINRLSGDLSYELSEYEVKILEQSRTVSEKEYCMHVFGFSEEEYEETKQKAVELFTLLKGSGIP